MSYLFELSFNIKKNKNINEIIDYVETVSYENYCERVFINYELMGKNRTIYKNNCIITISFEENNKNIYKFIKTINNNKNLKFEIIYYDNITINLIYISNTYLKTMEKQKVEEFLNKKNKKLFNKDELKILNALK
jgi:hypothetical protein